MTSPVTAAALGADPALIRGVALFAPALALVLAAVAMRPGRRETAAVIVSAAWCASSLFALNLLAIWVGWWDFHVRGAALLGVPIDLWLGWSVLWGALSALACCWFERRRAVVPHLSTDLLRAALLMAVCGWLDIALMPMGAPVVRLGPNWLLGEAIGLLCCLLPAMLLSRWTARDTMLAARMWAQALLAGLGCLAAPALLLATEPFGAGRQWPPPPLAALAGDAVFWACAQILAVVLLPGVAAAREFAAAGRGTPLPFDPPRRLVTSGPYSYVRNPMQTTMALGYPASALLLQEPRMLLGAVVALGYSAGLANWQEDGQLERAFAQRWGDYRSGVRPWLPRLRPWPGRPAGVLYVARSCDMCRGVGAWLAARHPVALTLRAAESHPEPLTRMRYESGGVITANGIAAFARALEHLHLGWALLGWAIALPGVRHLTQLATDAFDTVPVPSPLTRTSPPESR